MLLGAAVHAEQLQALREVGGSTGIGLQNFLKQALMDSSECRNIFIRVRDYFWKGSRYENKWFIGMEISKLEELKPKYIVVFERVDGAHKSEIDFDNFLKSEYTPVLHRPYIYHDPRLFYRNHYYFHSTTVYERKKT